jgi:basic membrane protein A and related proteins
MTVRKAGARQRSMIGVLLGLMLVLVACGTTDTGEPTPSQAGSGAEPIKAAWIYLGSPEDGGWTLGHDEGRKAVEAALGDQVETTFKANVPESPQVSQVIDDLVADGNKIIFGTSFGYMDYMLEAAKKYPDVYFEHVTGFKTSTNMSTYNGAQHEANYLAGIAAAKASKSGKLGYVAPFPIPIIISAVNAWALGAQSVNPDVTVRVVWTNTWFDPAVEKQAAESLLASGADVIGESQDTPSACQAAEAAGAKCTGNTYDQAQFTPDAWLTGNVLDWAGYYTERVQAAIDGTWKTQAYYGNLGDGMVDIASFGKSVDPPTRDLIEQTKSEIAATPNSDFAGPIVDQDGKERVASGEILSIEDTLGMDWFVAGVIGSPKGA